MRWLLHTVGSVVVCIGGLMGIFAAAGLCVAIWGASILTTVLGQPPEYEHPAFWIFLLTMIPGMIVGFAGTYFLVYLPLQIALRIPPKKSDLVILMPLSRYARMLINYVSVVEPSA